MPETCKHPRRKHTAWWWVEDPNDPVPAPYSASFDNRADAMQAVGKWTADPHVSLRWVKVFRTDNEVYECFRWENPDPLPPPPPPPVVHAPQPRRWWHRGR